MTPPTHLVLYDADRIKEFVFATGRLKEIRGGSQLVKDATEQKTLQKALGLADDEIVYADGGAGILQFDDGTRAEDMAWKLQNLYREITHGATLTAVVQKGADFPDAKERGERRLRVAKENRRALWQTAHSPFTQACRSCGARPATSHPYAFSNELLCDWCLCKRHRSDKMSRDPEKRMRLLLNETPWGAAFLSFLSEEKVFRWLNAELPETTDELAECSRPANYIGFLYADGNSMGSRFNDCPTADEHRHLSQQVSFSLAAALYLALNHHFPGGPVNGRVPFEVIALGGDDLILLCAAHKVLPVAITLSKLFTRINGLLAGESQIDREKTRQAGEQALAHPDAAVADSDPITLSCAAIIAHPKQPILNLEKEALGLLSAAKRAYPGQPVIDFHIVSSPILRSLRDIRSNEYQLDKTTHLTRRPLLLAEAERLLCHAHHIKSGGAGEALPRNKLNALYQALYSGQEAAAFEAFFLYYRLRQEHRDKLDAFFKDFGIKSPPPLDEVGMPWGSREVNGETQIFTVLADLAELYEFVEASNDPDNPAPALAETAKETSHDPAQS